MTTTGSVEQPSPMESPAGSRPDFQTLFESAPGLFLVLDPELRITAVSEAYAKDTMTRREDVIGKGILEVFPDTPGAPAADWARALNASLLRVLRNREPDAMAVRKLDIPKPAEKGGGFETRFWNSRNSPVLRPDGTLACIVHRVEDVTECIRLKQANSEITRLYEKARELGERKTRFFADVSHELRTPLALILGPLAKLLAREGLNPEARGELEVVLRNARLLHRHVGDLLDVARLDAGRMAMRYSDADLAQMAGFIASHFESLARQKAIRFTVEAPPSLPAQVDKEKIHRVLLNLLYNAFKFTPETGTVALSVRKQGARAEFRIRDSGPGVPQAMRKAIFERFRQGAGAAPAHGGTGLGLAIVNEFVMLHCGTITVSTAPEGGADFTVSLPLLAPADTVIHEEPGELDTLLDRQAAEDLRPPRAPAGLARKAEPGVQSVLVVEDNADMNAFLAESLGAHYRVLTAFNGREGLEQALRHPPDLIVCDVMMPGMSGEEMIQALGRHKEMDDVPVIVLTAKEDDAVRLKLLESRVQDYIVKPFNTAEILARVGRLLADRRRHAQDLETSERRFQATFDQAAVGIAHVAPDGRWLRVNRKLCEIVGYSAQELMRRTLPDITHHDDRDADREQIESMLRGTIANYAVEKRCVRKGGRTIWVNLTNSLMRDESGAPEYFITVVEDIDRRKADELQLRKSRAELRLAAKKARHLARQAEAANVAKSQFLANMSHELRTPLNGLVGMMQLLRTTALTPAQLKYTDLAIRSGARLAELLGDILDLSSIEANRVTIHNDPFSLGTVFTAIQETFAPLSREKDLPLDLIIDQHVPPLLLGDETRVRQVLFNLVGNAMKFTRTGSVSVEAHPLPLASTGRARLLFTVADTGEGIPDERLKDIFEPFVQAEESYRRDFEGAGLGLTLVRRLVDMMGGSLAVDSAAGRGTVFYVSLPFGLPEADFQEERGTSPVPRTQHGEPPRILLVEENGVTSIAMKQLLQQSGYLVTAAFDGQEALTALAEQDFDLILMDIQMPVMDGVEATRAIRNSPELGAKSSIPIIAMTAYAMDGDREKFLAEGMNAYIAKPVDIRALKSLICRVLSKQDEEQA